MTLPDLDDRLAWVDVLADLAKRHGASAVAITFDFGEHDVTYTAAGPDEDDGE